MNIYEQLSIKKWYCKYSGSRNVLYVHSDYYNKGIRKTKLMHRIIMNPPDDMEVDHIDGNGLNNQKSNLRIVSRSINQRNRGKNRNNTSGYKGVSFHSSCNKWRARVYRNRKEILIGMFTTPEEAHLKYLEYIKNENSTR